MNLSIPSITEILNQVSQTFKRFPFVILSALIAAISGISIIEISFNELENITWLTELSVISTLGISLFLAVTTLSESLNFSFLKVLILRGLALFLLVAYYFLSDAGITDGPDMHGYRFSLLFLSSHLFVAFAPFLRNTNINEFWGYNKTIFLDFFKSAVYSAILFIGLSIALLSLDALFGIDIKPERYFQLWIFIVSVFNTIFFLSNVPKPGAFQPHVTQYPSALKSMVQYVLIPLVSVYILILYSYMAKILLEWELPTGWVANLVLSFSIAGILSLLLLHPIKNDAKNNWIKLYSKGYFIALLPLVVLLFISIGTRISEYGVTINRFFVATLAVWLAGIVVYFVLSKNKNIKIIPISLALIALAVTFGPLSAFSVSERSQKSRVTSLLEKGEKLNSEGYVIESNYEFNFDDRKELSSVIEYLNYNHGPDVFSDLFTFNLSEKLDSLSENKDVYISNSDAIANLMGIEFVDSYTTIETEVNPFFNFSSSNLNATNVADYHLFLDNILFNNFNTSTKIKSDLGDWIITLKNETVTIHHLKSDNKLNLSLTPLLEELTQEYRSTNKKIPTNKMLLSHQDQHLKVLMRIINVSGNVEKENSERLTSVQFQLFITEK